MHLIQIRYLLYLFPAFMATSIEPNVETNYKVYHEQIDTAENLLGQKDFVGALAVYKTVVEDYDFVFLRDYKIATQVALYIGDKEQAFAYLKKGIGAGWTLKELKKDQFLAPLKEEKEWETIKNEYASLHAQYLAQLDEPTRKKVKKMYKKDQWKALGAFLKLSEKAREKYAIKKFAPHSENQIAHLIEILENGAYPGEKRIGNDFWMSTIVSHHNSISVTYNQEDPLYPSLKAAFMQAIAKGEMSPYEYALIDDWQIAVTSNRKAVGYGFLNPPKQATLSETNALREKVGLRTVATRNKLIEVENSTGMRFYLPDWVYGKIEIEQD